MLPKTAHLLSHCFECENTYHDAAMHPGPQPQPTKAPPPLQVNGGEGEDGSNVTDVRTSCTEVCGSGQWGRSWSKICLAMVYPRGFQIARLVVTVFVKALAF